MTGHRPQLDDATEAYVRRVVDTFPPLSEASKRELSRLVTPPRPAGSLAPDPRADGGHHVAA